MSVVRRIVFCFCWIEEERASSHCHSALVWNICRTQTGRHELDDPASVSVNFYRSLFHEAPTKFSPMTSSITTSTSLLRISDVTFSVSATGKCCLDGSTHFSGYRRSTTTNVGRAHALKEDKCTGGKRNSNLTDSLGSNLRRE